MVALHVRISHFKADEVRDVGDLKLCRVLNRNHALRRRNVIRQDIEKCGLPDAGAPAYENVIAGSHENLQIFRGFLCNRAELQKPFHGDPVPREFPDCQHRFAKAYRRQNGVHPRSVLQSGIHNGIGLVNDAVHAGSDFLNDIFEPLPVEKTPSALIKPAVPLVEDSVRPVHHDFGHIRVLHQVLNDIEPPERVENILFGPPPLADREPVLRRTVIPNGLFKQQPERLIVHLDGPVNPAKYHGAKEISILLTPGFHSDLPHQDRKAALHAP